MNKNLFNNKKGFSNQIIAVLVIVAVASTIIGTWLVLDKVNKIDRDVNLMQIGSNQAESGKVTIGVLAPAEEHQTSSGRVQFEIKQQ